MTLRRSRAPSSQRPGVIISQWLSHELEETAACCVIRVGTSGLLCSVLEPAASRSPRTLDAIAELERRVIEVDGGRLKLEWGRLRRRSGDRVEPPGPTIRLRRAAAADLPCGVCDRSRVARPRDRARCAETRLRAAPRGGRARDWLGSRRRERPSTHALHVRRLHADPHRGLLRAAVELTRVWALPPREDCGVAPAQPSST